MRNQTPQPYKDGIATIYEVSNGAEAGNLAKKVLKVRLSSVRYDELKVGVTRYYAGMQNREQIDQVLRMPRINSVSVKDIVKASDGNQYEIKQVQYPKNVFPPSMDLALERNGDVYELEGS